MTSSSTPIDLNVNRQFTLLSSLSNQRENDRKSSRRIKEIKYVKATKESLSSLSSSSSSSPTSPILSLSSSSPPPPADISPQQKSFDNQFLSTWNKYYNNDTFANPIPLPPFTSSIIGNSSISVIRDVLSSPPYSYVPNPHEYSCHYNIQWSILSRLNVYSPMKINPNFQLINHYPYDYDKHFVSKGGIHNLLAQQNNIYESHYLEYYPISFLLHYNDKGGREEFKAFYVTYSCAVIGRVMGEITLGKWWKGGDGEEQKEEMKEDKEDGKSRQEYKSMEWIVKMVEYCIVVMRKYAKSLEKKYGENDKSEGKEEKTDGKEKLPIEVDVKDDDDDIDIVNDENESENDNSNQNTPGGKGKIFQKNQKNPNISNAKSVLPMNDNDTTKSIDDEIIKFSEWISSNIPYIKKIFSPSSSSSSAPSPLSPILLPLPSSLLSSLSSLLNHLSTLDSHLPHLLRYHNQWIVKPAGLSRGRGISLLSSYSSLYSQISKGGNFILQKYIENPFLIHNKKFDIRQYILVVSNGGYHHLYFYRKNCYFRLSSEDFTLDKQNKNNLFVHLTNNSIQKDSEKFDSLPFAKGNMWDLPTFQSYLHDKGYPHNIWDGVIRPRLERIVTNIIQSSECYIDFPPYKSTGYFSLYGVDIMLDDSLTPWILEVNSSPTLVGISIEGLVEEMVGDMMRVVVGEEASPLQFIRRDEERRQKEREGEGKGKEDEEKKDDKKGSIVSPRPMSAMKMKSRPLSATSSPSIAPPLTRPLSKAKSPSPSSSSSSSPPPLYSSLLPSLHDSYHRHLHPPSPSVGGFHLIYSVPIGFHTEWMRAGKDNTLQIRGMNWKSVEERERKMKEEKDKEKGMVGGKTQPKSLSTPTPRGPIRPPSAKNSTTPSYSSSSLSSSSTGNKSKGK